MTEVFYDIGHLTTADLRELFCAYRPKGWVDFEYHRLMPEGVAAPELPDEVIVANIDAGNPHNYFVFMQGHEDEQDGVMIGFGLRNFPDFGAYLHLGTKLLGEVVEKYALKVSDKPVQYSPDFGKRNEYLN